MNLYTSEITIIKIIIICNEELINVLQPDPGKESAPIGSVCQFL